MPEGVAPAGPVPLTEHGAITLEAVAACLTSRTKLVAIAHVANALGTVLPVHAQIAWLAGRNRFSGALFFAVLMFLIAVELIRSSLTELWWG